MDHLLRDLVIGMEWPEKVIFGHWQDKDGVCCAVGAIARELGFDGQWGKLDAHGFATVSGLTDEAIEFCTQKAFLDGEWEAILTLVRNFDIQAANLKYGIRLRADERSGGYLTGHEARLLMIACIRGIEDCSSDDIYYFLPMEEEEEMKYVGGEVGEVAVDCEVNPQQELD